MPIIPSLPFDIQNGTPEDATQVMANFNEIVTDVNANAAASGANSDITSLTGLTTPISIAQGGTGQTSAAAALIALGGIGAATADTLTNKTIDGGSNTITGITEASLSLSNVTTGNVTTARHGFAPIAPNDATKCLDGTGAYSDKVSYASKSDMETATSTTTVVNPAETQNHKGVAKAWVQFDGSSGAIAGSYNVTSVTRNSAGNYTVTFTTAFANTNYSGEVTASAAAVGVSTAQCIGNLSTLATGTALVLTGTSNGSGLRSATDAVAVEAVFYGVQ